MRLLAFFVVAAFAFGSAPAGARIIEPAPQFSALGPRGQFTDSTEEIARVRPPPKKVPRRPRTPRPDPRRPSHAKKVNPLYAGLAAAGGAGGGALIGTTTVGIATLVLLGVFGAPTLPVTITAAVIAIGIAAATPFLAGLGGGGAVLAMDPRTKPQEWSSLFGCATSGCCAGFSLVGGTVLGGICGQAPQIPGGGGKIPGIPDLDKPAEWTAGAAIAGLVGGAVVGALLGWSVAENPDDPLVPVTVGALGGAVLGSAVSAGVGGGLATAIRK